MQYFQSSEIDIDLWGNEYIFDFFGLNQFFPLNFYLKNQIWKQYRASVFLEMIHACLFEYHPFLANICAEEG